MCAAQTNGARCRLDVGPSVNLALPVVLVLGPPAGAGHLAAVRAPGAAGRAHATPPGPCGRIHPALLPPAPQGAALRPLHLPHLQHGGRPRLLFHVRRGVSLFSVYFIMCPFLDLVYTSRLAYRQR